MKASKKLPKIKGAQFYKIGDKVETIKEDVGAWFTAVIIDMSPNSKCECEEECRCTYKLLFEGDDKEDITVVDRRLHEIRQVSYSSMDWDKLKVGMKVVINYNIEKPKQWGYWYDYIITDLQKRNDVIYLKGTLLVGYEGCSNKLTVNIDSDNVADVLEIRPHATLIEKEMENFETGVKPDYCKKCRNKPKVKCKSCCCCKCGDKKDFELTVQCDECDDWYHIYCLVPPILELPSGDEDWYCPKCNNETHRAQVELKHKLKKQRQISKPKRSPIKVKRTIQKPMKNEIKITNIMEPRVIKQFEAVEVQEITKIPKYDKIWKELEHHFDGCKIIRIIAEIAKNKDVVVMTESALNPEIEEYINKDVANELLWAEAKENISKGEEAFLEAVKRIFTCAICCDILDDPITLSCKHNFCIDCFFRSLSVNVYNCPLCRVDVIHTQHYVVNENLKKALTLLFKKKLSKKINS